MPAEERFGLTSQMRRAAVAIPANIAEGQGRRTDGEFLNQLSIAHGSVRELETHVMVAGRLGHIPQDRVDEMLSAASEVGRLVTGLAKSLTPTAYCLLPTAYCLLQESPIKRNGQQFAEAMAPCFATKVREHDFQVAAELPEDLAARSTRWCRTLRVRNDRDAAESLVPLRQRLEHRHALGADGQTVCRVLDVAPGDNRPVNGLERRTHFELRKRCVRVSPRLACCTDQIRVFQ